MTSLTRTFIFSLMVLLQLQTNAFAETEKVIQFENQREEIFDLENWLKEITYTTEERDSTCYRTEYRTEYRCRNVTRYRQECRTIPSRQECRQVNDPICSYETRYERQCHTVPGEQQCRVVVRYRRECHQEGGGRQCRTIPGDIVCRIEQGENRCTKIPPREVCENTPGRQVCRDVPYEERECHTGPSRQECRDVPRQERVCRDNYETRCETIPSQHVCEQVPYTEEVCGNEEVPYQVPYACKKPVQVPHETILKTHKAHVEVKFNAVGADLDTSFRVALSDKGEMSFTGNESDNVLAFLKKDIKVEAQGDLNNISALYHVALYNRRDLAGIGSIHELKLSRDSLNFKIKGKFDHKRAGLQLTIKKKDEVQCEKALKASQFKSKLIGTETEVSVDLRSVGCKVAGSIMFNKTRNVALKLKLDFTDLGTAVGRGSSDISAGTNRDVEIE